MKKGDTFPTGFGIYKIVEIKNDIIYAIKKDDVYNIGGIKTDRDMYAKVEEIINEIRNHCGVKQ